MEKNDPYHLAFGFLRYLSWFNSSKNSTTTIFQDVSFIKYDFAAYDVESGIMSFYDGDCIVKETKKLIVTVI